MDNGNRSGKKIYLENYIYIKNQRSLSLKKTHNLDSFSMLSVTKQMKISPLLPDTFPDTSAVPQLWSLLVHYFIREA